MRRCTPALTPTIPRSTNHDGRWATITPSRSCTEPAIAKVKPSTRELVACEGTIARWMAPAETSNVASEMRAGALNSRRAVNALIRMPPW